MGIVTDCQAPIKTRKDFKTTWTLMDRSIQDEYSYPGVLFDIFRPEEKDMPSVRARDVVVLSRVKVQRFANTPRLIAHHSTAIHIYISSKIPKHPATAKIALVPQRGPQPTEEINRSVCEFYHHIDKAGLPDELEFSQRQEMSLNVKDKFSLLSGVQEGNFYDLIVRVVRDPYFDSDSKATLYVSDYTENEHFHLQTWQGLVERQGGDPWGYTSTQDVSINRDWHGPDGKRSMQITVYPPHASVLLDDAAAVGSWLHLRNVQIKYGRNGQFYEGFLREDSRYPAKVNATLIDLESQTRQNVDPRLKQAYSRYLESEREKRNLRKSMTEAKAAGEKLKRKASEVSLSDKEAAALNRRQRRNQSREALQERWHDGVQQSKQEKRTRPQNTSTNRSIAPADFGSDLNPQITCETHYEELTTIASMLEPCYLEKIIDGRGVSLLLPFVNRKYQSRVRVVDFFPPSLQDFAVEGKKKYGNFDFLSDDGVDSPSSMSGSGDSEDDGNTDGSARRVWEWRFSLQLEDAPPPGVQGPKSRVWVVIGNGAGQCLTNLDAADLSKEPKLLAKLRRTLAVLLGNLEEVKNQQTAARQKKGSSSMKPPGRPSGGRNGTMLERPTASSSDVEMEDDVPAEMELDNEPFVCCIQQYGVKDSNKKDKDAWVRMFGMFGVRIRV
ncbi:hypothetical protein QBC42DRAFT_277272 [Cladorrhinum samala]|uniref:Protection of telomeres protein 1 n=1 Tax=Cladorrhinum samala TaxID=585594 RepID=A0AAV9HDS6_9PEZI|nr:hypothetical protein QBC42DRAFT_277272 [Cladorrhinum samala]